VFLRGSFYPALARHPWLFAQGPAGQQQDQPAFGVGRAATTAISTNKLTKSTPTKWVAPIEYPI